MWQLLQPLNSPVVWETVRISKGYFYMARRQLHGEHFLVQVFQALLNRCTIPTSIWGCLWIQWSFISYPGDLTVVWMVLTTLEAYTRSWYRKVPKAFVLHSLSFPLSIESYKHCFSFSEIQRYKVLDWHLADSCQSLPTLLGKQKNNY